MKSSFALLLSAWVGATACAQAQKPNIIILYADDMGYGDLGANNPQSKIPTPHLDQLAQEGMRFTDGHSSSGVCTPSRYAMLTGRYHWRKFYGISGAFDAPKISADRLTIPALLKTAGYTTAAIGKWHLGMGWAAIENEGVASVKAMGRSARPPEAFDWSKPVPDGPTGRGFDYYFGDAGVINFAPYCWMENDRILEAPTKMHASEKDWRAPKEKHGIMRPGPMVPGWDPYKVLPTLTQKAVAYVKAQAEADAPFFLYMAFPSPHAPIVPNDEFDGRSQAGAYGDLMVETDDACGQILAALEATGQADNTLVIFTADNGSEQIAHARDIKFDHWSSGPFRGVKRDIYEGGHHVPFVVKWPGMAKPGAVSDGLVSQIDIMATLGEIVGANLPAGQAEDSQSFLPLLRGAPVATRKALVHNTFEEDFAIRQDNWVLVFADGNPQSRLKKYSSSKWDEKHGYPHTARTGLELYDLKTDLGQRHNVAAEYPERVKQMQEKLNQIRQQGGVAAGK